MGMYVLKRLGGALVVVLLLLTGISLLVHVLPGDPAALVLGPNATPELSAQVRQDMQLDASVPAQVWHFITGVAQGDLGSDFVTNEPVTSLLASTLPHTLILALTSLLLSIVLALVLGILAAARPGSRLDRLMGVTSVGIISIPSFVVGLLLLLVAAVQLGWFPAIGTGELSDPADYVAHLVLPALSLALIWAGYLARIVRASMLEVLSSNYVRMAQAYGISSRRILFQLALRNAVIPVVAMLGIALGEMMGSAIFVEVIFTRSGIGTLMYDAIADRNFTIIRGGVVVIAILFVVANLLADIANRLLDPRTRQGAAA